METKPTTSTQELDSTQTAPTALSELRDQIACWRSTRSRGTRMPEELWSAAVAQASEHGVWRVAQSTRVRFDTLKARFRGLDQHDADRATIKPTPARPAFVEVALSGATDVGSPPMQQRTGGVQTSPPVPVRSTSIELSSDTGARLVINLGTDSRLEIESLAAALWRLAR